MDSNVNHEERLNLLERRVESLSEAAIVQGRLQWGTDRTVSGLAEDLRSLSDRLGTLTGIVEILAGKTQIMADKVDRLADHQQVLFSGLDGLTQRLDRLEGLIERFIQGRNGHSADAS